jgi:hypothetical protein
MSLQGGTRGGTPRAAELPEISLDGDQCLLPDAPVEPTPAGPPEHSASRELLVFYRHKLEEFDVEQEHTLATLQELKRTCASQVRLVMDRLPSFCHDPQRWRLVIALTKATHLTHTVFQRAGPCRPRGRGDAAAAGNRHDARRCVQRAPARSATCLRTIPHTPGINLQGMPPRARVSD